MSDRELARADHHRLWKTFTVSHKSHIACELPMDAGATAACGGVPSRRPGGRPTAVPPGLAAGLQVALLRAVHRAIPAACMVDASPWRDAGDRRVSRRTVTHRMRIFHPGGARPSPPGSRRPRPIPGSAAWRTPKDGQGAYFGVDGAGSLTVTVCAKYRSVRSRTSAEFQFPLRSVIGRIRRVIYFNL